VVYLARAKGNRTRLLAVKTMKPGKVWPFSSFINPSSAQGAEVR
jgi:hypothetical protein